MIFARGMRIKTLKHRFLFVIVIVLVLPFSILLITAYIGTQRSLRRLVEGECKRTASNFSNTIQEIETSYQKTILTCVRGANFLASSRSVRHDQRDLFWYLVKVGSVRFLSQHFKQIEDILLADATGKPLAKIWPVNWAQLEKPYKGYAIAVEDRHFLTSDFYWAAQVDTLSPKSAKISPPVRGKSGYVEKFAIPVYFYKSYYKFPEDPGKFLGMLFASVRFDAIFQKAKEILNLSPGNILIAFDSSGTILYHPDPAWVSQKLSRLYPSFSLGESSPEGQDLLNSEPIALTDWQGRSWIMACMPFQNRGWYIAVLSDVQARVGKLKLMGKLFISGVGLTLLLATLALGWNLRRIVRTLQNLTQGAKAIAQGDLERRIKVTSPDELGTLARAFNSMAQSLKAMIREQAEKEKLRELNELKSAFIAHVSHELRRPLNLILMGIDNLKDGILGPVKERQMQYLNRIRSSAEGLLRMINELLDLSRIEAGRLSLNVSHFSLSEVVQQVIEETHDQWRTKELQVIYQASQDSIILQADREKLKEVLLNLMDNAIKFTPSGGRITVSTRIRDESVEMVVEDTGVGIAPEHLEHIFERFYRVKRTGGESPSGLGLGLNIVRSLVELHGGTVQIESQEGVGTKVTATIPLVQRNEDSP